MINLLKLNVFIAAIKKKEDRCFSFPIHPEHQKYLLFFFNKLYQFICTFTGYRPAMKIMTKLTKVTFFFVYQRSLEHSTMTMWMTHICKEIPASYALTISGLPFRLSHREVTYHPKENHYILRISHILYQ